MPKYDQVIFSMRVIEEHPCVIHDYRYSWRIIWALRMILASQAHDHRVNFYCIHMPCPVSKSSRHVISCSGTDHEYVARVIDHLVREFVRAECVVIRPIIWISPNEI